MLKINSIKIVLLFSLSVLVSVYSIDNLLNNLLSSDVNSGQKSITITHFSWHFQPIFSVDSIGYFLGKIVRHKEGMLGEKWFYVAIVTLFILLTLILLLLIFTHDRPFSEGGLGWKFLNFVLRRKYSFIGMLLFWVLAKQLLFVVLIPPLQGPDETTTYFKVGSYTKEQVKSHHEIVELARLFDFAKLAELPYIPNLWWSKEQYSTGQPKLYFLLTNFLGKVSNTTQPLYIIYLGRAVSSFSIVVTVGFIYLISRLLFSSPSRQNLVLVSTFFAGTHPQLSYVGATFSADAMAIMFITVALYLLVKLFKDNRTASYYYSHIFFAFVFALLAVSTKTTGSSILPSITVVFLYIIYSKSGSDRKAPWFYFIISLFFLFTVVMFWMYDIFGIHTFFQQRVVLEIEGWLVGRGGTFKIDFESMKSLSIYFVSFWLSYGWMVFKMSVGTYLVLALLSVLLFIGVAVNWVKKNVKTKKMPYLLLFFNACVVSFFCYVHSSPQGRFLFPAISFFSIIFAEGLYSLIPEKYHGVGGEIILSNLLFFNLIAVFGILIPVFYL